MLLGQPSPERLAWIKPFTEVKDTSFDARGLPSAGSPTAQLNVAANCLDRHLGARAEQTAILWEPRRPERGRAQISYRELHERRLPVRERAQARSTSRKATASRSTCR